MFKFDVTRFLSDGLLRIKITDARDNPVCNLAVSDEHAESLARAIFTELQDKALASIVIHSLPPHPTSKTRCCSRTLSEIVGVPGHVAFADDDGLVNCKGRPV